MQEGYLSMSMTRDSYAREVLRAAEAAFYNNESPKCPREDCNERLIVVQQKTQSTRSLFCPVHGRIYQEQSAPINRLDWDAAAERVSACIGDDEDIEEERGYDRDD